MLRKRSDWQRGREKRRESYRRSLCLVRKLGVTCLEREQPITSALSAIKSGKMLKVEYM